MIVDDVEVSRYATAMIFEDFGFNVVEAEDGPGCIESLTKNDPNVILIDWHLRKESGLDLIARIRQTPNGRHVPILVYSGIEKGNMHIAVNQAGAVGYIAKPATREQVETALRQLNLL